MKVERKKVEPMFEPIVITIETKQELDALYDVLHKSSVMNFNNAIYKLYDKLYNALNGYPVN